MQRRDIVVIGASAGGLPALIEVVRELPQDFPGAIFVVVHTPQRESKLPAILSRSGLLPATHARHRELIVPGRIYVAPPDFHLIVRPDAIELSHGPRENHFRPAVDPLFRTAARAYGPRVVGVVLSGALNDGAAGLMAIKAHGGAAIVQDPQDAINESMPRTALQLVDADSVLPARGIANKLVDLASQRLSSKGVIHVENDLEHASKTISDDFEEQISNQRNDELTPLTCPDCGGTLWQTEDNPILTFQCHVGHRYVDDSLLNLKSDEVESALWAAMRLLKERATLTRQVAERLRTSGEANRASRIEEQATLDDGHVRALRELIEINVDPISALILESQSTTADSSQ